MNSSRLRSVSAAPKLAITMMMTALLRSRSAAEQQRVDEQREPAGQRRWRRARAIGSDQPKENGPIGAARPPDERAERAADRERDIGAPGDELAMREVGEAQDRIGERDADGAEPDHRAGDQAVHQRLRVHGAAALPAGRRDRARRRSGRRRGSRPGPRGAMRPFDEDDGAVGDGERGLHVLLDQDDGDAGRG